METHQENNVQQEIIDSMAKKITGLDRRQSKNEELNLDALFSKVDGLEMKVYETAEMRTSENSKQLERFDKQLIGFDEKINAIPKEIRLKNNIQFDPQTKFVIRTILGLGGCRYDCGLGKACILKIAAGLMKQLSILLCVSFILMFRNY